MFAKILRGELPKVAVYEDDLTLGLMDIMPSVEGHTLVITKEPAEGILDLSPDGAAALIKTTQKIAKAVKKAFDPPGRDAGAAEWRGGRPEHSAHPFPCDAAGGRARSEAAWTRHGRCQDAGVARGQNQGRAMILEHAVLNIRKGQSREFEAALAKARPLIEATEGFQRMEIRACVETGDRYLLLVWWSSVEAHTVGFRQSSRFEEWRAALHPFYEPFPTVQHYGAPL